VIKVKIFGDSHSSYFKINPRILKLLGSPDLESTVKVYKGGSMTGFGKRSSTLNLTEEITGNIDVDDFVIFNFGQVDIELGFYYKRIIKREEINIIHHMDEIIEKYILFVRSLNSKNIVIKGINIPSTCHSEKQWQNFIMRIISPNTLSSLDNGNVNANIVREEIKKLSFDDRMRTNISFKFNEKLKWHCNNASINYYDINEYLVDETSGLIKDSFLTPAFDNHIADSIESRLLYWNGALKEIEKIKERNAFSEFL